MVAGGAAVAAIVVAAVAAVHLGMRAAVGMAAHGTTPARGRIGAGAGGAAMIATADRRHSRSGKWQAYLQLLPFVSAHSTIVFVVGIISITAGVAIIVAIAFIIFKWLAVVSCAAVVIFAPSDRTLFNPSSS
jgi:hypothetical protein